MIPVWAERTAEKTLLEFSDGGDLGEKATKIIVTNVQHLKSEEAGGLAAIVVL